MRIAIEVTTPAQLHFWKNIIRNLEKKGHDILLILHQQKSTLSLAEELGMKYEIVGEHKKGLCGKILTSISIIFALKKKIENFKADICIGEICTIFAAWLLRKPSIIFEDDEVTWMQRFFYRPFVTTVITPHGFRADFGKKHVRMKGYKELAYLIPKYFSPDKSILRSLGFNKNEKFIILRWNTWDAIHDVGKTGFDKDFIVAAIEELEHYAKVLISSERELPQELQKYAVNIPFSKVHSLLNYASLLISDTQTMTTEAVVLGTPAVRSNSFVGPDDMSNFIELEKDYGLLFNFKQPKDAIRKAIELIQIPNLKRTWAKKREKLLSDKIDAAAFMTWFIENYPESSKIMKENPNYQDRFS